MQLLLAKAPAESAPYPRRSAQMQADLAPHAGLQLSVSHSVDELESIWRKLEASADLTVFQSFDWLSTWQRCIGAARGVVPAIVVGGLPSAPLFILPLAIETRGPLRELVFLAHDLSDYNAPILAPEFAAVIGANFAAIWPRIEALLQDTSYHLVRFDKMPARIGDQANPLMALGTALHPSGAYATALKDDWAAYYKAKRNGKSQRQDRSKRKHLAESGDTRLVTATTPADADATVGQLIAQKERSLQTMGAANLFDRPGHRDFYAALSQLQKGALQTHVCHLQVGDLVAATNLGLRFRGRYYYILASYDDGPISRFGPGVVQLQELMAYATAQGDAIFDFTIGDERYKREWCEIEIALYDHVSSRTVAGKVGATVADLGRRLKRSVKQSPWLWPLAVRIRAKLASLRR